MTTEPLLPPAFADLEPAVREWCMLDTSEARAQKRLHSTMDELKAVYDALLPRIEAMFAYLDTFPVDKPLAGPEHRLFIAGLGMAEISHSVEIVGAVDLVGVPPDNFNMKIVHDLSPV